MAKLRRLLYSCLLTLGADAMAQDVLNFGPPLKGAWVADGIPGQGLMIESVADPAVLFIAWFTFPRPMEGVVEGVAPHRWYTIEGLYGKGAVEATIYRTRDGEFLGSAAVVQDQVGSATIRFKSCNEGRVDYEFVDSGESGAFDIHRAIAVSETGCTELVEPQVVPDVVGAGQAVVFWGVTVLEMPGATARDGRMVVVENGEISHVGPVDLAMVPEGAMLIDGRSRYLLPGMVDTHTHLGTNVREFLGLNASPGVVELSARNQLILYLARGVTSILNNGDFGEPLPEWGERVESGEWVGPAIYAAQYSRGDTTTPDGGPPGREIFNATQAREFTVQARQDGYRFMKIYNHTPRDGVLAILDEAAQRGMPVIGHFPQTMPAQEALDSGLSMVAHSGAYLWRYFDNDITPHPNVMASAIEKTRLAGASVTATVGIEELIDQVWCQEPTGLAAYWAREETRYMHSTTVSLNERSIAAEWRWSPPGCTFGGYSAVTQFVKDFTRQLHEGGVRILMGTDSPTVLGAPGFSAVDEVQALVNSGISLPDALQIATYNGGEYISTGLELDQPFGAIRKGWRADLLLLEANPLSGTGNLEAIAGVMAAGRWKSAQWLAGQLEMIAAAYGN